MQQLFLTPLNPVEYFNLGINFPVPRPKACLNPGCLIPIPPKKHGFYQRNAISDTFELRIFIRRYYCPYCGRTCSYLPAFCLPYFQYVLELIYSALLRQFLELTACLIPFLKNPHPNWQKQHLNFYCNRFLRNQNLIKLGLRQLIPELDLPISPYKTKGAQKVLSIVVSRFNEIQTFSQRFYQQCTRSFMAPY